MSYDEDPPTRRLPVPPREPLPRERVPPVEPGVPGAGPPPAGGISEVQLYDLEQRLRSMRSWLTALAAIALVALVVAAIALISAGDDDEGSSSARTPAGLRRSVERLEERVDDRVTKGQLADVKKDIDQLKTDVSDATSAAAGSGDTTTTTESADVDVSSLQNDLSDLSARVEALEQAPSSEGTATEGTTP